MNEPMNDQEPLYASNPPLPHPPFNDDILRAFFYGDIFSQAMCERVLRAHWDPQRTQEYLALQEQFLPGFKHYRPKEIQALAQIPENLWLRKHLHQMLSQLNARHYHFEAAHLSEVQLMTFKQGEGLDWYSNIGLGPFALRKLCVFVVLSEDSAYAGGVIHALVRSASQSQGNIVVLPSIGTLCLQKVTRGELKILFATLDGDRPFR